MADNKSRIRQIYIDKDGNISGRKKDCCTDGNSRKNEIKKNDIKKTQVQNDVDKTEETNIERKVINEKELKRRILRHKRHRIIRIAALIVTLVLLLVLAMAAGTGLALVDTGRTPSDLAEAVRGEVVRTETIETGLENESSKNSEIDDVPDEEESEIVTEPDDSQTIEKPEAFDIIRKARESNNDKLKSIGEEIVKAKKASGIDTIGKTLSKNINKVDALTGEDVNFLDGTEFMEKVSNKENMNELDDVPKDEGTEISGISQIYSANDRADDSDITKNTPNAVIAMSSPDYYYPLPFTRVDENYFTDALFIGDSRMLGFGMWSNLPATFYCMTGFQLYNYETAKVVQTENGRKPIFEAIPYDAFSKIYIKVGLNEMGWGNKGAFEEKYAEFIERLREVEPRAVIFVQAILPVTKQKSASSGAYNKKNIDARNKKLKAFAESVNAYYIDAGPYLCDAEGNLRNEMTTDGVHLAARYMDLWKECFFDHGIVVP